MHIADQNNHDKGIFTLFSWLIRKMDSKVIHLEIDDCSFVFTGTHALNIPNIWNNGKFLMTDEDEIIGLITPIIKRLHAKGALKPKPVIKVNFRERKLFHPEKIAISYYLCQSGARDVVFSS